MKIILSFILSLALFSILYIYFPGNYTDPQVETSLNKSIDHENNSENQQVEETAKITKEDLVIRVKQMYPNVLASANLEEFTFDGKDPSKKDEFKLYYRENGEQYIPPDLRGTFIFYGKELTLIAASFGGDAATKGNSFPPKVDLEESRDIAEEFLNQIYDMSDYGMKYSYYHDFQRPLTEILQTEYEFYKMKNGIRISDQGGWILVQGDGRIRSYNYYNQPYESYYSSLQDHTYDSPSNMLSEDEIKQQLKNELNVQLKYISEWNSPSSKDIYLAYAVDPSVNKINAIEGTYYIDGESMDISELNSISTYQPLSKSTDKSTYSFIKGNTEQYVLKILEQILKVEQSEIEIDKIEELKLEKNLKYSISFNVNNNNGEMMIDGDTGDFYYLSSTDKLNTPNTNEVSELSINEAREFAMEYINQLSPVNSQDIVWRDHPKDYSTRNENYSFEFHRLINGIPYEGDEINVIVSKKNGKLIEYFMSLDDMDQFPIGDIVISQEEAFSAYLDQMSTDLYYEHKYNDYYEDLKQAHYNLIYGINFKVQYVDATTGEIVKLYGVDTFEVPDIKVNHSLAEDEINYMIQSEIIMPDKNGQVQTDHALTVEQGISILVKSLYNKDYINNYPDGLSGFQTFHNIQPDMAAYPFIESAADKGIIDTEQETFNLDESLTREKLAYWFVRLLDSEAILEQELSISNFTDSHLISDKYEDQVELADALGLITKNENGEIHPQESVTTAQLAIYIRNLVNLPNTMNNDKFIIR
ncbi:YcdB/YcdC domain-containing protein [Chengkuizengella sediminis]|uniref:YcdB/YcdC domain-containing protein n=1 Tax=Chengkuizengella sediminis TaxID=1885917 RepID=UPI001389671F|nr:YcdB/YcdC domain-containing protein [Chengkuizengella sediminis]NDI36083.1 hypothetical protein [Chengkuizengella sediminis]